jgi:hypothetical protein
MTDIEVMAQLQLAFEYTYLHDDWVTPLAELLGGVSMSEALRRPTPNGKNIWEIVLHLAKWNENIVDRVQWRDPQRPDEDAHWPKPPLNPTEEAWLAAQTRLDESFAAVAHMLETVSLDEIQASKYCLGDLVCRFTHAGYHIGQITKIREFMALG